jgi:spore germination protein YaaH
MAWCKNVASYAFETIGEEKLVMGLPFYGRSWGNVNYSKAYLYSGIEALIAEQGIKEIKRDDDVPVFEFTAPVAVKVFYDDAHSLSVRMRLYEAMGVKKIGFWLIGQETPAVWELIYIEHNLSKP